ncbi:site-specific integrase [Frigoriglobus tundricola]|uniref:Tyr recombinase domain-containing protein n=1 Tax=Frigoriglobus tundricola TaxID=2774151 RepID=A0A6M5YN09_9BACT|nr:site-specific integrase [Frigoriglobus tundricola]QJW94750.1 hypothetical protein FTUN_2272 [Frigoriglobus tundricola]
MPNPPKLLTVGDETLTYKQWAERPPYVSVTTISSRLRLGWSPKNAVTVPPDRRFRPTTSAPKESVRPCPKLRPHKATGQAYCEWQSSGERHVKYFGKWQSEEAKAAYARFTLEWATRLVQRSSVALGDTALVCELVEAWIAYCKTGDGGEGGYLKHGRLTSRIHAQQTATKYLTKGYGLTPIDQFGPDELRAVRKGMIDANLARKTINGYQGNIVQMFGWGVGRKLVKPETWHTLQTVGRLLKGKTTAPDWPKKRAAKWEDVEAAFPFLHDREDCRAALETLIRVHWLIGGRPQDLTGMRVGDIDRSEDVWHYVVNAHKNEHREQDLDYFIGPRAQPLLAPLLAGKKPTDFVFLYPPLQAGGQPVPIRRDVYGKRVKDACKRAKVKPWTPHQLRHSRATEVMRMFESNEAAAAAIGDSPEVTRLVYVDPQDAVRKRIARVSG